MEDDTFHILNLLKNWHYTLCVLISRVSVMSDKKRDVPLFSNFVLLKITFP